MRVTRAVDPGTLTNFSEDKGLWYESPEAVQEGLEWGRQKAELLRWVRRTMRRELTPRERRCVYLYYFKSRTIEEVGTLTGTGRSSAHRAILRAIGKLRAAAQRRRKGIMSLSELGDVRGQKPEMVPASCIQGPANRRHLRD